MNWFTFTTLTTIASGILFFYGILILVQEKLRKKDRQHGIALLIVSLLGFLGSILSFSDALIISPEFGLLMVQGHMARLGLGTLIVGFAAIGGYGWYLARSATNKPVSLPLLLGIGFTIGIVSAVRILALNPDEQEPFRVYAYDIWLPLLIIWVTICLIQTGFAVFRFNKPHIIWWVIVFVIGCLSLCALHTPCLKDPWSLILWSASLILVLPAIVILSAKKAFHTIVPIKKSNAAIDSNQSYRESNSQEFHFIKRDWGGICLHRIYARPHMVFIVAAIVLICWFAFSGLDIRFTTEQSSHTFFVWMPWLNWLGGVSLLIGLITGLRFYHALRADMLRFPALPKPAASQIVFLLNLIAIALNLSLLLYDFKGVCPATYFSMYFLMATIIAQIVADRRTLQLFQSANQDSIQKTKIAVRSGWGKVWKQLRSSIIYIGRIIKQAVSIHSAPVAIIKVMIGIGVLIALNEIPNTGKTIIQPFKTYVKQGGDNLGPAISDRLLNNLGMLRHQLRPDIIIPSSGAMERGGPRFVTPGGNAGMVEAALAKSSDLQIGGVKIPIGLIAGPIQAPMRALMDVHVINGSLQTERDGYTLMANSSMGETWITKYFAKDTSVESPDVIDTAIATLSEELAFKIVSTDPKMTTMGMTNSWEAFQLFQRGLKAMERYEAGDDKSLTISVEEFRNATIKDPHFALAYYRLGLALQRRGQPASAAAAFRASIQTNGNFTAGYIALAYHLYYFDSYYYPFPASVPLLPVSSLSNRLVRMNEARRLWHQVLLFSHNNVDLLDRAYAYYGLSQDAIRHKQYSLAYYYGKRVENLYDKFTENLRFDPRIMQIKAYVFNTLGIALASNNQTYITDNTMNWHCDESTLALDDLTPDGKIMKRNLPVSPHHRTALYYYNEALALQPDELIIRCNAASTAYSLGDVSLMKALEQDADAHVHLATRYTSLAKAQSFHSARLAASYYRLALSEYQTAIDLAPTHIDALHSYAYTFWQWRLDWLTGKTSEGPDAIIAHQAELHARQAIVCPASKHPKYQSTYRSTLGEVLLGQGRIHEAIEEIEKAYRIAKAYEVPDEIRWDLAQAYLIMVSNHLHDCLKEEDLQQMRKQTIACLEEIRNNEQTQEFKPFTRYPKLLDAVHPYLANCLIPEFSVESKPDPHGALYVLIQDQPAYESYNICDWMGIVGEVYNSQGKTMGNSLRLHVWGGGVEQRISLGEPREYVFLNSVARDTHDYYFVQLEGINGKPVSEVYPFTTYADCSRNLINMVFEQKR